MAHVIDLSSSDSCESLPSTSISKNGKSTVENKLKNLQDSDMEDSQFELDFPKFDLATKASEYRNENIIQNKPTLLSKPKHKRLSEHFVKDNYKNRKTEKCENVKETMRKQEEFEKKRKEREIMKEQHLREKLAKKDLYEQHKVLKPGECIKYMRVLIDPGVLNNQYGHLILSTLDDAGIATQVGDRVLPCSIGWLRQMRPHLVESQGQMSMSQTAIEEPNIVLVWTMEEFLPLVKEKMLITKIENIKSMISSAKITLALCGVQDYFKQEMAHKSKSKKNTVPLVTRRDFEFSVTELQIKENVDHRILKNAEDLGLFIQQFTKSVAETPFKNDRYERDLQTDGCTTSGPKDCVGVVNGIGLTRLFKQQLVQFNRATLETAEAIISKYPTLKTLLQAYENCSPEEGSLLLSEISVRRAAGPLSNIRKIGPEMSKRVFIYYTSMDGQVMIGE